MTASMLLAWVSAALGLQLAIAIAVAVWRRSRAVDADVPAAPDPPVGAWSGWRAMRVVRRDFEDRAQTICSFYLEPVDDDPLAPFAPGQFITVAVPTAGGRTVKRSYSMSDAPSGRSLRISVKRALPPQPDLPPGLCSGLLHDRIRPGDMLQARAPAGRFVLDAAPDLPVVLIAGGIGVTPLLSMLRGGAATDARRLVHLYYGVRAPSQLAFGDELAELTRAHPNLRMTLRYSLLGSADAGSVGEIDVDLLRRTLPAGRHRYYLCGPPGMLAKLTPALLAWGVQPDDIRQERFGPARPDEAAVAEPSAGAPLLQVTFRDAGRTIAWDARHRNLLAFAEHHGVPVESGCRTGTCGACEVRLVSGEVLYDHPPEYAVRQGHCLLCVGKPGSDVEVVA